LENKIGDQQSGAAARRVLRRLGARSGDLVGHLHCRNADQPVGLVLRLMRRTGLTVLATLCVTGITDLSFKPSDPRWGTGTIFAKGITSGVA